ncbi:MAG: HAMP domain-containing protein, partial [Verrucomicrobia bacterium]
MFSFHKLPIKHKLMLVITATSVVAVLVVGAAAVSYELARYHGTVLRDLTAQAEIVAANSEAAMQFHDPKAAQETLAALRSRRMIVWARVFTANDELFAEYVREGVASPPVERPAHTAGSALDGAQMRVWQPIFSGHDFAGVVCLQAELTDQRARLKSYAAIGSVVMLAALLASLLLSSRLQELISAPILDLADVARAVTSRKDYSLRAQQRSADEIGELEAGFNQMLSRIEERDDALRASEERFRQLAESIGQVFWLTNPEKTRMVYVSPAYEKVWG